MTTSGRSSTIRMWTATALLVLVGAAPAFAGNPLQAEFDSRYKVNGQTINAHICLNGNTGTYTLDDGTVGTVTVSFHSGGKGPKGPRYYTGTWSLGGESGTFRWNLYANDTGFVGSWYNNAGKLGGPWNGQQ